MNNKDDKRYKLKEDFLNFWNKDRVQNMTLEQYTNLNKDDSFCYWLESRTTDLGSIWGGSAYKFGIYKRNDLSSTTQIDNRKTDGNYAWYAKYGNTKEEAFKNVKTIILDIIDATEKNDLERIDKIDLGTAYKWKIAFLYGNYNIINIFKDIAMVDAVKKWTGNDVPKRTKISTLQKMLIENMPADKDYYQVGDEFWAEYERDETNINKVDFIKWLKSKNYEESIADELEEQSEEVVRNGFFKKSIYECSEINEVISIGYQTPIKENKDAFKLYLQFFKDKLHKTIGLDFNLTYGLVIVKNKHEELNSLENETWDFYEKEAYIQYLQNLTKGSRIAMAYKILGTENVRIHALGEIKEDFIDSGNVVVKWTQLPKPEMKELFSDIKTLDYYEFEFNNNGIKDIQNIFYKDFKPSLMTDSKPKFKKLNIIYHGVPGTGKTFQLVKKLKKLDENNDFVVEKFQKLDNSKQFYHIAPGQGGYLWNDFKQHNRLGYEWCNFEIGDLKQIKRENVENYNIRSYFSYVKKGDYFCVISGKKFYGIAEALDDYNFDNAKSEEFWFQTIPVKWIKIFDKPELLNTTYTPTFGSLKGGLRWDSLLEALKRNKIIVSNESVVENPKEKSSQQYIMTTFHQSFSYEDFIEGIKPDLSENSEESQNQGEIKYVIEDGIFKTACDKACNLAGFEDLKDALGRNKDEVKEIFRKSKPFYLLIDEINRGNIASVFGELITLIEEDKRLSEDNEVRITLPYSKSDFCIPPNLHIIGTMNTADRSVEALDTALRRRFSFVEFKPDLNSLDSVNYNEVDLKLLLKTINHRIEVLLDKNHVIGQYFFINISDLESLKNVFRNKIIPLLEEYFYGDYGKIGLILGSSFVEVKQNEVSFANDFTYEGVESFEEKIIYQITSHKSWTLDSFKKIYA